jgi:hypothetical protein
VEAGASRKAGEKAAWVPDRGVIIATFEDQGKGVMPTKTQKGGLQPPNFTKKPNPPEAPT